MKVGRRLAIKVLNASRFALGRLIGDGGRYRRARRHHRAPRPGHAVPAGRCGRRGHRRLRGLRLRPGLGADRGLLLVLLRRLPGAGEDPVLRRPAEPGPASARGALALALSVQLRLFAPFLPFVTEEVWSWWQQGSVHRAGWPEPTELGQPGAGVDPAVLEIVSEVLGQVRRAKTGAKRSMRAPVAVLTVTDSPDRLAALSLAEDDLRDAGGVIELVTRADSEPAVDVVLAEDG